MQIFKPGWKDIFRMNQNELESEIRKVSRDEALDPRRKAYLIQNLMTRLQSKNIADIYLFLIMIIDNCFFILLSRWIASQQKSPQEKTRNKSSKYGCSRSFHDTDGQIYGCEHYKRNCKLVAVCCDKLFTCRFCHDKVSDHSMDR